MTQRSPWPLLRAALLLVPAACLIAFIWYLVLDSQTAAPTAPGNLAAQVRRQQAALEHRLNEMLRAWQQDPGGFSVASWNRTLGAADGTRPDVMLVSRQGVVAQSSVPGQAGTDLHDQAWFHAVQQRADQGDTTAIASVRVSHTLQDWHLRVVRWLPGPGGRFAGALLAEVGIGPLDALFRQATPQTEPPLLGQPMLVRLLAGAVSALLVALAVLLFVWGERARRRNRGVAHEHGLRVAANDALLMAEAHAEALAAQLDATAGGMSDGFALLDPQLRLVAWNQHFADLAGVPGRLLQPGTTIEDILRAQAEAGEFGPVPVEPEVARRLAVLRSLPDGKAAERTRADGRVIALRRRPLPDGSSVALYHDVTGQRQADKAVRQAQAAADSATAAKSRFIGIIGSEIRAPLSALLHALQLLDGSSLPPARQALLRMALQSGDSLLGLVDDILEMSSMEAGQIALRPGPFALAPVLQDVVDLLEPQAVERGITLRLASDPAIPAELYADRARLRQVLVNLLGHTVRFGIPGPVALLARPDTDATGRPMLHVAVRDRGPVLEEAGRTRLFRPFSGLDLTGEEPLGSSLGLAICRYLVTRMGGEIGCTTWVAEDRHVGNEYWLRLPLAPLPSERPAPEMEPPAVRLHLPRTRILLVDGNPAPRLLVALLLRREGHLVDVADHGEAALAAIARQPYDLVFADIRLPDMAPAELMQRMRDLPGAPAAVPVVGLGANVGPEDRLAAAEAGLRDVLDKPAALPQLLAALARHAWTGFPARNPDQASAVALPAPLLLAEARIGELRTHLPPDALCDMVQECLIALQSRLPALQAAVLSGDNAAAANHAHAMMGMAAGYGMAALETRLRTLMVALRGPNAAAAASLLSQLETDLAQSAQALREALLIELV